MAQIQIDKGAPLEIVYPTEGTPLITGPSAIMKKAPNPNAAKLFQLWSFSPEGQQIAVKVGALRSAHPLVKDTTRPNRRPLADIKLMKENAAEVEQQADSIKKKYAAIFKV